MTEKKELIIKCCKCRKEFSYYSSEFRPFCSEKCKLIDLGHWFDESYSIEGRTNSVYIEENENFNLLNEDSDETD